MVEISGCYEYTLSRSLCVLNGSDVNDRLEHPLGVWKGVVLKA